MNQRLQEAEQPRNLTGNSKKTAIRETRAALQSMIDRHFEGLEQEIDAIEHCNHTAIKAYRTQLEDVKKRLEARESEVTQTLASKNHMKIMQGQKTLANNLDEVVRSLQGVMQPVKEQYWIEGINELQAAVVKCLPSVPINRSYGKISIELPALRIETYTERKLEPAFSCHQDLYYSVTEKVKMDCLLFLDRRVSVSQPPVILIS